MQGCIRDTWNLVLSGPSEDTCIMNLYTVSKEKRRTTESKIESLMSSRDASTEACSS